MAPTPEEARTAEEEAAAKAVTDALEPKKPKKKPETDQERKAAEDAGQLGSDNANTPSAR